MRSKNIIKGYDKNISDLNILYHENDIDNLTITNIVFWNKGKETIHNFDIANDGFLKISPRKNDVNILYAKVIQKNNNANKIKLVREPSNNEVKLYFEYLDFNDGAVFQIMHTGISSDDLKLKGTIKGYGQIKINSIRKKLFSKKKLDEKLSKFIQTKFGLLFLFSIPIISYFHNVHSIKKYKNNPIDLYNQSMQNIVIMSLIFFIVYCTLIYFIIKRLPPKGLGMFKNVFYQEDSSN